MGNSKTKTLSQQKEDLKEKLEKLLVSSYRSFKNEKYRHLGKLIFLNRTRPLENLIREGLDIETKFENGLTLLAQAVIFDSVECVILFLKYKANPNVEIEGIPLVSFAALNNMNYILYGLLKGGADTERESILGFLPIHCAIAENNSMGLEFLIDHGACISNKGSVDIFPITLAQNIGMYRCVRVLMKKMKLNLPSTSLMYEISKPNNRALLEFPKMNQEIAQISLFLCCARNSPESLFSESYLPLDLFRLIVKEFQQEYYPKD